MGEQTINAKTVSIIILLITAIIMVACGGDNGEDSSSEPEAPDNVSSTETPSPTSLPEIATPVYLGTSEQPVQMLVVLPEVDSDTQRAARDLGEILTEQAQNDRLELFDLEMAIEVDSLNGMDEALVTLCEGEPGLVWVDAFTYIAAERQCGAIPLMQVQQGRRFSVEGLPRTARTEAEAGLAFSIVFRSGLRPFPAAVTDLAGANVCRLGPDDRISWVYFSLALRAEGINPVSDLGTVTDVEDYVEMVREINDPDGACDVGAIPRGTLPDIVDVLAEDEDDPVEIDLEANSPSVLLLLDGEETWPAIPHMVLVAAPPPALADDLRESTQIALERVLDDGTNDDLQVLLPHEEIVAVTPSDFDDFREWLDAAGWSMAR